MSRVEQSVAVGIIALLVIGTLLAWCPWLNAERAEVWAQSHFNSSQEDISDGCGIISTMPLEKELFGYRIRILYGCGLMPANSKREPMSKTYFVSAIGIVR